MKTTVPAKHCSARKQLKQFTAARYKATLFRSTLADQKSTNFMVCGEQNTKNRVIQTKGTKLCLVLTIEATVTKIYFKCI